MGKVAVRNSIRFWLNDELVELPELSPNQTLLDYLRLDKMLRGSKEGCAEGDCGACTVLVGRLAGNGLIYESVNSCIRLVASLDGCHIVTIEHLARDGDLHPVQQALVDHHGSQCGFCTPGIVMSLYGLWMQHPNASTKQIETALQGNLCRCTGYAPIIKAALAVMGQDGPNTDLLVGERTLMIERLSTMADGARVEIEGENGQIILPASLDDFAELYADRPHSILVAGATDVGLWVTKFMRDLSPALFISHVADLRHIRRDGEIVTLGAGVTYTDFAPTIAALFPQLTAFWDRIGGTQVRNMGTIGGNIANGSPIGDTPPALIALEANIVLRYGSKRRTIRLEDYFVAYGKQDRGPGEFLESISIPILPAKDQLAVYKISKRRDEDISSVCGAFRLRLDAENRVIKIIVAFGGMAATPKRASAVEKRLLGAVWDQATIDTAIDDFAQDFQPISDMRASADYRLLVAQNLLQRFYFETQGQQVQLGQAVA